MVILLTVVTLFLFMFHGLGFIILLNGIIGILELLGVLFGSILGYILLGIGLRYLFIRR